MLAPCHLFVKRYLQLVKNVFEELADQLATGFPASLPLETDCMPATSSASLERKYLLRRSRSCFRARQDRAFTAGTLTFRASAVCCKENPSMSRSTKTTLNRGCSCFNALRRISRNSPAPWSCSGFGAQSATSIGRLPSSD